MLKIIIYCKFRLSHFKKNSKINNLNWRENYFNTLWLIPDRETASKLPLPGLCLSFVKARMVKYKRCTYIYIFWLIKILCLCIRVCMFFCLIVVVLVYIFYTFYSFGACLATVRPPSTQLLLFTFTGSFLLRLSFVYGLS